MLNNIKKYLVNDYFACTGEYNNNLFNGIITQVDYEGNYIKNYGKFVDNIHIYDNGNKGELCLPEINTIYKLPGNARNFSSRTSFNIVNFCDIKLFLIDGVLSELFYN